MATYYRCVVCWTLTSSDYIDYRGDICIVCGAGLLDRNAPMVDVQTLPAVPRTAYPTSSHPQLAAAAYDPDGAHCGSWYIPPPVTIPTLPTTDAQIAPRSVGILQSRGPGDALRFLHAALGLLARGRSPHSQIIVFIDLAYAGNVVGLCSSNNLTARSEDNTYLSLTEQIGELGSIRWVALKQETCTGNIAQFVSFINQALAFLQDEGYRWYSPNNQPPVMLEPYHGSTRFYRFPNIQMARIDLNLTLMEEEGYLHLPRPQRVAAPPGTVRALLYLRMQNDERSTPKFHVDLLRACQETLAQHPTNPIQVQVTLAGLRQPGDYATALTTLGADPDTVYNNWGWRVYGYGTDNYQQQFAHIAQNFDVAVGINTSALDLAAAAGCVIVRDREWKQGEYPGKYYNLFLLSAATFGIFSWDVTERVMLFQRGLECVLSNAFTLPRRYKKCTVTYAGYGRYRQASPAEEVIGTLD